MRRNPDRFQANGTLINGGGVAFMVINELHRF